MKPPTVTTPAADLTAGMTVRCQIWVRVDAVTRTGDTVSLTATGTHSGTHATWTGPASETFEVRA